MGEWARFNALDAANPRVWVLFVHFTFEKIHRGFQHYSAWAVINRVRWETDAGLHDGTPYKITNKWIAYYARKFHQAYPQHNGFFRTRAADADTP